MTHDLKTLRPYFRAVRAGEKPFELRLNDRNFEVGDVLNLRECCEDGGFTGQCEVVVVSYILRLHRGLEAGWCIMAIKPHRP